MKQAEIDIMIKQLLIINEAFDNEIQKNKALTLKNKELEKQLLIQRVSKALDLVELQRKIDEVLDSETSESLKEWLHSKRL
jgi:hypothetical protein